MSDFPLSNPAQMLAIYSGLCGLLYVETDGFRRDLPVLNAIPILSLAILTLTLRMKTPAKQFTALSFCAFAIGVYLHTSEWRNNLQFTCAVFTIAQALYALSFIGYVQRMWHGCAIAVTVYLIAFLYFCFADMIRSIPTLVISLSVNLIVAAVSLIAAGSVWLYGSKGVNAQQAALLRFLGLLLFMLLTSLKALNLFGKQFDKSNYLCSVLFYIAQPLMFFANERAF
ncbi:unnamed protein product [Thelazia callipaeda]|uniref:lysoplasmalogenase n=1 Tax=Thelazia callipaeda TaxID=103827 RepID=A0A0N5CVH4_THECL|nr:unnamed protein product [Thelazia callipaeda]